MPLPRGPAAVIYAPGGGQGHLTRALVVAAGFKRTWIFHHAPRPPAQPPRPTDQLLRLPTDLPPAELTARLRAAAAGADTLVVDTFPGGLWGEVDAGLRAAFRRTILIRRILRPEHDEPALAAAYDAVLLPYPAAACEWEGEAAGEHVGYLLRPLPLAPPGPGPVPDLWVIGARDALPPGLREAVPAGHTTPLRALPRAARYLALGAGYNLCYELNRLQVPFRAIPLERRYDDQFARALRLGVALVDTAGLRAWQEAA